MAETRGGAQLLALTQGIRGIRPVDLVFHGVEKGFDGVHFYRLPLLVDFCLWIDDDLFDLGLVPDVAFFGHLQDVLVEILRRCVIIATDAPELVRVVLVEVVAEFVFGVKCFDTLRTLVRLRGRMFFLEVDFQSLFGLVHIWTLGTNKCRLRVAASVFMSLAPSLRDQAATLAAGDLWGRWHGGMTSR